MKKLFLSVAALAAAATATAQQPKAGTISIIPRIGVSLANLPGDQIYINGDLPPLSPRYKAGFLGGVDVDWQFMPNMSVMVGAQYVQQGCRYENNAIETDLSGNVVSGSGYSGWSTQLHYINVPVMLNAYIGTGFALKAGVQIGFPVSGKMKFNEMEYVKDKDGNYTYEKPVERNVSLNSSLTKVTLSVPVGVSYEFSNVIIDARYNIGLTKFQDIKNFDSSKNRVFTFSAAYRFEL